MWANLVALGATAALTAGACIGVAPAPRALASAPPAAGRAAGIAATPDGGGYWIVTSTGAVFPFGDAHSFGDMAGRALDRAVVGVAATPSGGGYWLVAGDGGIFSFGDAAFWGSTGALHLNAPIVGMASTADGRGYWLVASDGGVFSFGDAAFDGSTGGMRLDAPVVGMASTADGRGYWLVASDGGVFSFGDAAFHGSTGGLRLAAPMTGMAPTPSGGGYWLVASDGGIFSFGDAPFWGSAGGLPLVAPVAGMAATPHGDGYWLAAGDGGVFTYGAAPFEGSATSDITPLLVDQLASTGGAAQVLVVDAPSASSTTATLTAYENDGNGWYEAFGPMPAVDGIHGWLPGASRSEGDGTTPEGLYAIGPTMYGTAPNPGTTFGYHQLVCGDWWDEDPSSPAYNTFQHVACGSTPPFGGDSEALWANPTAYPSFAVIDFNTPPSGPLGSAIFLHADTGSPTVGCVSLPLADLDAVLAWLKPALHPVIVMGPDDVIRSF